MPAIRPFRALRYNPDEAGDLSRLIAPPYDVIDPAEQDRLYQTSPHNIVRLILGKAQSDDTETENRYTRAQRTFRDWREAGVLRPDPAPALYLISHTFAAGESVSSRLGFIALTELDEGVERAIYRHEATMDAPKRDRTKLLDAVPAHLEPVFCLYPDPDGRAQAQLHELTAQTPPTAKAEFQRGTVRLWAVTQPDVIQRIAQALASTAALIADGHHRFEVAFANRRRYGTLMTYYVSMADPSLVMRPIHRIVHTDGDAEHAQLRELCRLEPASGLESVLEWLRDPQGEGRFGFFDGRSLYRVQVTPEQLTSWLAAPAVPAQLAGLDVSLLHGLVLPRAARQDGEVRCSYTVDAAEAIRAVKAREGRSAWLMRGIPLPKVYDLAGQGLSLPPKSTFFYPKVPSGLTINPLT